MATKIVSDKTGLSFDDLVYDGYQGSSAYTNTINIPVDGYQAYADSVNKGFGQLIDNDVYLKTNKIGTEGGSYICTDNLTIQRAGSLINLNSSFRDDISLQSNDDIYLLKKNTGNGFRFNTDAASMTPINNAFYGDRVQFLTTQTNLGFDAPAIPEIFVCDPNNGARQIKIKNFASDDYDVGLVTGKKFTVVINQFSLTQSPIYIVLYGDQSSFNAGDGADFGSSVDQKVQCLFGPICLHSITYEYYSYGTARSGRIVPVSYSLFPSANLTVDRYQKLFTYVGE